MAQPSKKSNKRSLLNLTPGGKTRVVRVEINQLNGRRFDHCLSTQDVVEIWTNSLKLKPEYLLRQASFRGPNDSFRINYRITEPAYLSELITNPDVVFEKKSIAGIDTYTGRVLDIDDIEEAKIGEVVTVVIKRSNAELSEEQIALWLMRFGHIVNQPRYKLNIVHTLSFTASKHKVNLSIKFAASRHWRISRHLHSRCASCSDLRSQIACWHNLLQFLF